MRFYPHGVLSAGVLFTLYFVHWGFLLLGFCLLGNLSTGDFIHFGFCSLGVLTTGGFVICFFFRGGFVSFGLCPL